MSNFYDSRFLRGRVNDGQVFTSRRLQRVLVGSEPGYAGSLSPNEHQPTTKNYCCFSAPAGLVFAIFCARPVTYFAY